MYSYAYPYWLWGRCRCFPWLPRWWWSGIYGPIAPYAAIPKEQEIAMLENQAKWLEQTLEQIRKRLKEPQSERKRPEETIEKGES